MCREMRAISKKIQLENFAHLIQYPKMWSLTEPVNIVGVITALWRANGT